MKHIQNFQKFEKTNEEVSLKSLAKGAILGGALALSSCEIAHPKIKHSDGTVEKADSYVGDVIIQKVKIVNNTKVQCFLVYSKDKDGNIIKFPVDEFNYSPGDTVHLDLKNEIIYPIHDTTNITRPNEWNDDDPKDWKENDGYKKNSWGFSHKIQ